MPVSPILRIFGCAGMPPLISSAFGKRRMDLSRLTDLSVRYYADKQGKNQELPGLSVLCREALSDIEASIYEPVLCLILQGSKVTSIGDQAVELGPGEALLVSHDRPV